MASTTDRQGAGTSQSREQGIIITIKAGSRTGFIRTVRRRERVFFHYASVAPLKARGDPEIGDNVDFILHNDGNRRVASDILYLPDGSVKFERVVEKDVPGVLERPLGDPKTGLFNRTAKRELSGGLLRRLEAAPGADEKGAPPSATIGVFEFHGRDVAPGLKLYIGDCVTFDVFVEMVTGRIGATNVRVRPGKRAKGFVHHLAPNKHWGVIRTAHKFPRVKETDFFFNCGSSVGKVSFQQFDQVEFNVTRLPDGKFEAVRVEKLKQNRANNPTQIPVPGLFFGTIVSFSPGAQKRKGKMGRVSGPQPRGILTYKRYDFGHGGVQIKDKDGNNKVVDQEIFFMRDSLTDPHKGLVKGDLVSFNLAWDGRGPRMKLRVRNLRLIQEAKEGLVQGIIVDVVSERRFCFINSTDRVDQIYAHFTEVKDVEKNPPKRGMEVEFYIAQDGGKVFATRVRTIPKGTVKFQKILEEVHTGEILTDLVGESVFRSSKKRTDSQQKPGSHSKPVKLGKLRITVESNDEVKEKKNGEKKQLPSEYTFSDDMVLGFERRRVILLKGDIVQFRFRVNTQRKRRQPVDIKLVTPTQSRKNLGVLVAEPRRQYAGSPSVISVMASGMLPDDDKISPEIASAVLDQQSAPRTRYIFWHDENPDVRVTKGDLLSFDTVVDTHKHSSFSNYGYSKDQSRLPTLVRIKVVTKAAERYKRLRDLEKLRPKLPPVPCNAVVTRLPTRSSSRAGRPTPGSQNYHATSWPIEAEDHKDQAVKIKEEEEREAKADGNDAKREVKTEETANARTETTHPSEAMPAASEAKPDVSEVKQVVSEAKPAVSGSKKPASEAEEAASEAKKSASKKSPAASVDLNRRKGIHCIFSSVNFVKRSTFLAVGDKITLTLDARRTAAAVAQHHANAEKGGRRSMAPILAHNIQMVPKRAVCIGQKLLKDLDTGEIYTCREHANLASLKDGKVDINTIREEDNEEDPSLESPNPDLDTSPDTPLEDPHISKAPEGEGEAEEMAPLGEPEGEGGEGVDGEQEEAKAETKTEAESKEEGKRPSKNTAMTLLVAGDIVMVGNLRHPSSRTISRSNVLRRMAMQVTIVEQAPKSLAITQNSWHQRRETEKMRTKAQEHIAKGPDGTIGFRTPRLNKHLKRHVKGAAEDLSADKVCRLIAEYAMPGGESEDTASGGTTLARATRGRSTWRGRGRSYSRGRGGSGRGVGRSYRGGRSRGGRGGRGWRKIQRRGGRTRGGGT